MGVSSAQHHLRTGRGPFQWRKKATAKLAAETSTIPTNTATTKLSSSRTCTCLIAVAPGNLERWPAGTCAKSGAMRPPRWLSCVRTALARRISRSFRSSFQTNRLAVIRVTSRRTAITALCPGNADTGVCDAGLNFVASRARACGSLAGGSVPGTRAGKRRRNAQPRRSPALPLLRKPGLLQSPPKLGFGKRSP